MAVAAVAGGGLLERDAELAQLSRLVDLARSGNGSLVVVEGEAGIGKTSLLAELAGMATERACRVLAAHGGELERDFAWGVVRQLYEAFLLELPAADRERLLGGAAGLAAPLFGTGSEPAPAAPTPDLTFSVNHGLYWLTANLAEEQPLVLIVDDAHWADRPSLLFLNYLLRRLEGVAIVVAAAMRPGQPGAPRDLLEPLAGEPLRLGGLSEHASRLLIDATLGEPSKPGFQQACHRCTGGNPFLLEELLRSLRAEGLRPDDQAAQRVERLGPPSIPRSVLGRLGVMWPEALRLAQAVAVLGSHAELRHAAALAGLDHAAAIAAADKLADASVLAPGRPLQFIHPVVREAIYQDLAPGRRAGDHARAARLVYADGGDPDLVGVHLLETHPTADPWVTERLRVAAGLAAARGSPDVAVVLLRRALEEPPEPSSRCAVLHELGRAEALMSAPQAIGHLRAALELATTESDRGELVRGLAFAFGQAGALPEAVATLSSELDRGLESTDLRLELEADLASMTCFALDLDRSDTDARLEELAPRLTGRTVAERGMMLAYACRLVQRGEHAGRAAEIATRALDQGGVASHPPGSPAFAAGFFALVGGDAAEPAMKWLEESLALSRAAGSRFGAAQALHLIGIIQGRRGALRDAEVTLGEALGLFRELDTEIGIPLVLACHVEALADRGLIAQAWEELAGHGLDDGAPDMFGTALLLESRGRLRAAGGDHEDALSDLLAAGDLYRRWGVSGPAWTNWRSHAAGQLLSLGRREEAAEMVQKDVELAERTAASRPLGIALRMLARTQDSRDELRTLERAVTLLADSPARVDHARALGELGAALRRANQRSAARGPLRECMELAHRFGATPLAERAREELRLTGARPRRLVVSGADALTPAERRVAEMAARDMSNREIAQALFVTRKTVETHLGHAYQKLGISSRRGLARALTAERQT